MSESQISLSTKSARKAFLKLIGFAVVPSPGNFSACIPPELDTVHGVHPKEGECIYLSFLSNGREVSHRIPVPFRVNIQMEFLLVAETRAQGVVDEAALFFAITDEHPFKKGSFPPSVIAAKDQLDLSLTISVSESVQDKAYLKKLYEEDLARLDTQ